MGNIYPLKITSNERLKIKLLTKITRIKLNTLHFVFLKDLSYLGKS